MSARSALAIGLLFTFFIVSGQKTGRIYLSSDLGESWLQADQGLPDSALPNDIARLQNTFFVATEAHGIYRSDDQGKNWRPSGLGLNPNEKVNAIAATTSLLFAGTYKKGIYISLDEGQTWLPANKGLKNLTIRTLDVQGDRIYAGTDEGLFISIDNGRSWQALTEGLQINQVVFSKDKLLVATHKGILLSGDRGQHWKWIYDQAAVRSIAAHGSAIYALGYGEKCWKTSNEGQSWLPAHIGVIGEERPYTTTILSLGRQLIASLLSGLFISYSNGFDWTRIQADLPSFKKMKWVEGNVLVALAGKEGC